MAPQPFLLLALLAVSTDTHGVALPEQTRGDMTARLTIHVADIAEQPGAALVRLTLTVTGGPLLEVEAPQLSDPVNAWEVVRQDSRGQEDGRLTWTERLQLHQVKLGPAALPDVKVRFRDNPTAPYQQAEWIDLLKKAREAPPPEALPPLPSQMRWLPWLRLAAVVLMVVIAGVLLFRRWSCSRRSLSPSQQALRELMLLQQTSIFTLNTSDYHALLSDVIRRCLAERYSLPALHQTTAEFLEAAYATGRLSAEQQTLLRDILERCDLAKFAPVGASPEECQEATAFARAFVEQTASVNLSALAR